MFAPEDFLKALASAREQLRSVMQALGEVQCPPITHLSVNLRDLSLERIEELLEAVPSGYRKEDKGSDYVYVFRIDSHKNGLPQQLVTQIEEARKLADDYCRVNVEYVNTDTLYVGRSKTLKARLRQHLGAESRGIFSMHLQRWATGNNAEVSISYLKFQNMDDLFVQAIEDGLWVSLCPVFGRKGER